MLLYAVYGAQGLNYWYWVSEDERFMKVLKRITSLETEAAPLIAEGLCGSSLQEAVVTGSASFSPSKHYECLSNLKMTVLHF